MNEGDQICLGNSVNNNNKELDLRKEPYLIKKLKVGFHSIVSKVQYQRAGKLYMIKQIRASLQKDESEDDINMFKYRHMEAYLNTQ